MAHRKFDNPQQGVTGFVRAKPQGFAFARLAPRRVKEEVATQEEILRRGGIVAGPYGTSDYTYWGPAPMPQRSPAERKEVSARISRRMEQQRALERQPITVAHREDAFGAGAFWDHYTLRNATGRQTDISHHADVKPLLQPPGVRKKRQYAGPLPGEAPDTGTGPGKGLLFIAGGNYGLETELPEPNKDHTPESDSAKARHERRAEHERTLLKEARLSGRPVLAVCGGSWRMLEAYGGQTRAVKPKTHQTRQMPYLTKSGAVARVASEHDVAVRAGSALGSAFRDDGGQTPTRVNSAHWAVAEESFPGWLKGVPRVGGPRSREQLLQVSARGVTPNDPPYLGKTGPAHPHSVEAFETRYGAPVLAVQWHPEAYDQGFDAAQLQANRRILTHAAQAGDAYEARRAATAEFKRWTTTKRLQPSYLAHNRAFQVARRNALL